MNQLRPGPKWNGVNGIFREKTTSARGLIAASIIEQFGDRKHPDLVSFAGSDEDFLMRRIQNNSQLARSGT